MAFVVRELSEVPENTGQKVVASVRYPPQEIPDVVVTELELWEVEVNVGGWWKWFTWSFWRSVLNMKPDYNVVLQQRDSRPDRGRKSAVAFVLHECEDVEAAQSAFEAICSLLEPLVDDCALMLTDGLLKELMLPSPRAPEQLVFDLVEIMEKKPEVHDRWKDVLHAVVEPALQVNDEGVQVLRHPGVGLGDSNPLVGGGSLPNESATEIKKLIDCVATHGSAQSMKQIIDRVGEKLGRQETQLLLEQRNRQGKTSLHVAFENNNRDVIYELMQSDSSLLNSLDSNASNPLHLAAQRDADECISAACNQSLHSTSETPSSASTIDFTNALNMRNGEGFTPLMLAVRQGYLNSAMSLLLAGADPDIHHPTTWNTALHHAAEVGNPSLVKLLIVFGADMEATNKGRKTPLEVACGSSQPNAAACILILEETMELSDAANNKMCGTFEAKPVSKDSVFLLSLDGGGMRVFVMIQILVALKERMQYLQPDCSTLKSYFDYIAGTSVGCLFGLLLSYLDASPEFCRSAAIKFSEALGSHNPTIPNEVYETSMTDVLGRDLKLGDIEKPRVIMTTVIGDRSPLVLHLMCNYGEARDDQIRARERKVWEVARASTAAPVYSAPFEGRFIDGGLMANNPTLVAMTEIFQQAEREGKAVKIGLVVSIGTGYPISRKGDVHIRVPRLHNILGTLYNIGDTISSLFNIFNVFISQLTQSDGYETQKAQAWCKSIDASYFRLSPQLRKRYHLMESDKAVVTDIMYEGHVCALKSAKEIDNLAKILLARGPCN